MGDSFRLGEEALLYRKEGKLKGKALVRRGKR
jgi:hypothetical protein